MIRRRCVPRETHGCLSREGTNYVIDDMDKPYNKALYCPCRRSRRCRPPATHIRALLEFLFVFPFATAYIVAPSRFPQPLVGWLSLFRIFGVISRMAFRPAPPLFGRSSLGHGSSFALCLGPWHTAHSSRWVPVCAHLISDSRGQRLRTWVLFDVYSPSIYIAVMYDCCSPILAHSTVTEFSYPSAYSGTHFPFHLKFPLKTVRRFW